ncbi:hypothetical protein HDU96_003388 [Phlyctochytrium bullatum]|nr:hypothetical protein HDU96_003388 [Phlyctochytrium bullatum]
MPAIITRTAAGTPTDGYHHGEDQADDHEDFLVSRSVSPDTIVNISRETPMPECEPKIVVVSHNQAPSLVTVSNSSTHSHSWLRRYFGMEGDEVHRLHDSLNHTHYSQRSPSLRAALLGANDGLLSIASIVMGFASGTGGSRNVMLLAGVSGMVAGALSMACGEYVSVASQKDSEKADLAREKAEFLMGPEFVEAEMRQLAGLSPELARRVVEELHASANGDLDRIVRIHARDELGIDVDDLSNPISASFLSALSFLFGATPPIVVVVAAPPGLPALIALVVITSVFLLLFGAIGAVLGGAPWPRAALRVLIGGFIGMGGTYLVGMAFERLS